LFNICWRKIQVFRIKTKDFVKVILTEIQMISAMAKCLVSSA